MHHLLMLLGYLPTGPPALRLAPALRARTSVVTLSSSAFSVRDDGTILRPSGTPFRLSPSSVATFTQCPLLFQRRHIERIPEPPTPELAAGILVHEALNDMYALPPEERSLERSQLMFRELWRKARAGKKFSPLFNLDAAAGPRTEAEVALERAWGLKAFGALRSYFELEDPTALQPAACEERLQIDLAAGEGAGGEGEAAPAAPIPMTGTVDRLDHLGPALGAEGAPLAAGEPCVVVDYKTGKAPAPRFRAEAFFQLQVWSKAAARRTLTPPPPS